MTCQTEMELNIMEVREADEDYNMFLNYII